MLANKKIAFVTCSVKPDFAANDLPIVELLRAKGAMVHATPWDVESDQWNSFDLVVIRSCWNYHLHPGQFQTWLDRMEREHIKIFNSIKTVRWNLHKDYLKELEARGAQLPETIWLEKGTYVNLALLLQQTNWEAAVVKPSISAGAFNTFLVSVKDAEAHQTKFEEVLNTHDMIVQQFIPEVVDQGEWSLIFFDKKYSHAIVKRPASKDFRVQQEHGGSSTLAEPPSSALRESEKILALIDEPLLYARVDGVVSENQFLLMELELIEPSLFLEKKPESAIAFADAINHCLQNQHNYASTRT
jgi:glutathione synthase/RimK-type ligase-like ATP-grasp enzyme